MLSTKRVCLLETSCEERIRLTHSTRSSAYIRHKMLLAPATGQKATVLFKLVFLDVHKMIYGQRERRELHSVENLCSGVDQDQIVLY
jgi:hypothetical protein